MRSVNNFCKNRPYETPAWSGFKLFDTLMLFLQELLKNDFEKNQQTTKSMYNCLVTEAHTIILLPMDEALTSVKRNESVLTNISCNGHMHISCESAD